MTFEGTLSLIIEESEEKPKYELILPEKYSRLYIENKDSFARGYIRDVIDLGKIGLTTTISRDSDKVRVIKEKWVPAILISGYELLLHIKRKNKKDVKKYGIAKNKYGEEEMFIINDTTDIDLGAMSWKYWLEPVKTYKDYTSHGVASEFDKLFDNL